MKNPPSPASKTVSLPESCLTPPTEPFTVLAQRGELLQAACPSRDVLRHITSQWGVMVMVILLGGTHRFSDLRRKIGGISEKMLTQTLRGLEHDGLVQRTSFPVVPPHVEYNLTKMGNEAAIKVSVLADWVEDNLAQIMEFRRSQSETNTPAHPRRVASHSTRG